MSRFLFIHGAWHGAWAWSDYSHAFRRGSSHPMTEKVDIDYDRFAHIPKVYVECKKDHALTLDAQRLMAAKYKCLHVALDTDHSPFLSTPKELVEILLHAD